jgi:hypothetical protein
LGQPEFENFINRYKIKFPEFSFLLRELGNTEWNLGYARNFALLYAKASRYHKTLFMDDDIKVSSLHVIEILFKALKDYKFTGSYIAGLIDDSILGHIATGLDIQNERMISGGFMAFNPNNISDYFLNVYNEDWIWLFLQLRKEKYLQTQDVFQEPTNPFIEYKRKIIFQEFGEIILDGILDFYQTGSYEGLTKLTFWERILLEREQYLNGLVKEAQGTENGHFIEIIQYVQLNSKSFRPPDFKTLFEEYSNNRKVFQKLFNLL